MHNCTVWILCLSSDRKEISEGQPSLERFHEGGVTSDEFLLMNWILLGTENNWREDVVEND